MSINTILNVFQHLPDYIALWTVILGPWIYGLLFAVIFAETGLVFAPFLPGDSLLFAVGALTANEGSLDLFVLWPLLVFAAMSGDFLNYCIGRRVGLILFRNPKSKLFNQKYLHRADAFYQRHGGKAVVLARFFPIIRTYAPFVAGLGRMPMRRYLPFNVLGGLIWVSLFLGAGHWFGNLPVIKEQFHYVILAIVLISALPALIEFVRARRMRKKEKESPWSFTK
jgi:membrane-associated protein